MDDSPPPDDELGGGGPVRRKNSRGRGGRAQADGDGGGKKYVCRHADCNKTFSTSGHLARHVRIHLDGMATFTCIFRTCSSTFSRKDNLKQHFKGHYKPLISGAPPQRAAQLTAEMEHGLDQIARMPEPKIQMVDGQGVLETEDQAAAKARRREAQAKKLRAAAEAGATGDAVAFPPDPPPNVSAEAAAAAGAAGALSFPAVSPTPPFAQHMFGVPPGGPAAFGANPYMPLPPDYAYGAAAAAAAAAGVKRKRDESNPHAADSGEIPAGPGPAGWTAAGYPPYGLPPSEHSQSGAIPGMPPPDAYFAGSPYPAPSGHLGYGAAGFYPPYGYQTPYGYPPHYQPSPQMAEEYASGPAIPGRNLSQAMIPAMNAPSGTGFPMQDYRYGPYPYGPPSAGPDFPPGGFSFAGPGLSAYGLPSGGQSGQPAGDGPGFSSLQLPVGDTVTLGVPNPNGGDPPVFKVPDGPARPHGDGDTDASPNPKPDSEDLAARAVVPTLSSLGLTSATSDGPYPSMSQFPGFSTFGIDAGGGSAAEAAAAAAEFAKPRTEAYRSSSMEIQGFLVDGGGSDAEQAAAAAAVVEARARLDSPMSAATPSDKVDMLVSPQGKKATVAFDLEAQARLRQATNGELVGMVDVEGFKPRPSRGFPFAVAPGGDAAVDVAAMLDPGVGVAEQAALLNRTLLANRLMQQQMAATAPAAMFHNLPFTRPSMAGAVAPELYPATARFFMDQQAARKQQHAAAAFAAPEPSFASPGLPSGTIDPLLLMSGFQSLPTRPALGARRSTTATVRVAPAPPAPARRLDAVRPQLIRRLTTGQLVDRTVPEGSIVGIGAPQVPGTAFGRVSLPPQQDAVQQQEFLMQGNQTMKTYLERLLASRPGT